MMLVIWVVCKACVRSLKEEENLMVRLLCASLVLNAIAFVFSNRPITYMLGDPGTARYLPTVPIFGALITAMSWQRVIARKYALYLLPVVACAYVAAICFPSESLLGGSAFAVQMFEPVTKPPLTVIKFLEGNGLTEGYGSYWSAGILSVISDGKIVVRQVGAGPGGIVPVRWYSSEEWYAMKDARFLIFKDKTWGVGLDKAVTTWGPPMQGAER